MNTGVTTNKNARSYGSCPIVRCMWQVLTFFRAKGQPNRGRHLLAQAVLSRLRYRALGDGRFGHLVGLLYSWRCIDARDELATFRRHPGAVHALVAMIVLAGGVAMLFGGEGDVFMRWVERQT